MKCPECGTEWTPEMIETGICYECGFDLNKIRQLNRQQKERQQIADAWKAAHPDADGKYYQYKTVVVKDKFMGQVNAPEIERVLNEMGYDGWRLVSSFTNEVGKNAGALGIGDVAIGLNATMDETVLVFERVVKV